MKKSKTTFNMQSIFNDFFTTVTIHVNHEFGFNYKELILLTAFPFVRKICLRKEHHCLSNS